MGAGSNRLHIELSPSFNPPPNFAKTVYLKKRHVAAPLKENEIFLVKKIHEFVDSEFVKICHEQVITLDCDHGIQSFIPTFFLIMK